MVLQDLIDTLEHYRFKYGTEVRLFILNEDEELSKLSILEMQDEEDADSFMGLLLAPTETED